MRAKCSTCGGSDYDSVLLCLGCDSARDAERGRLQAEIARREEELVSITGDLHKLIDGLEAEVTELRERLRLQEAGCSGWIGSLRADNARLRAALAKREFDDEDGGLMCSACRGLWPLDGHRDTAWDHCHEHHPDCPDFSANGVVR